MLFFNYKCINLIGGLYANLCGKVSQCKSGVIAMDINTPEPGVDK